MVDDEENRGDVEFSNTSIRDVEHPNDRSISKIERGEKIYSYDEALDLTGHGKYHIGLLITLCCAMNAMAMDLFGFSVVVNSATCDLKLEYSQKSLLVTIPLVGPIITAYPWGYFADTRGRRRALLIAIWGSLVSSVLSAFSFNWIMLAILKLLSSSFSGGIQSISYTLLGEMCAARFKNTYILILSSTLMSAYFIYTFTGYIALNTSFTLNIGFITFTPWRLLTLILASSLGTTLLCFALFHESPKFLLNAGHHEEALDVLKYIHKNNGGCNEYPVKKIVLNEMTSFKNKDVSFLKSLKEQTLPLFKTPLLQRTLQLYYIIIVIYTSNNGFFIWLPFLSETFFSESSLSQSITATSSNDTQSLCAMIRTLHSFQRVTDETVCTSPVNLQTLLMALIQGVVFTGCSFLVATVADRKKMLLISILLISGVSGVISVNVTERILGIVFFFGVLLSSLCIGIAFSYFVDLYPTSYRGMASCVGIMVARSSAVFGVNLLGAYIVPHCTASFYLISAFTFSAVIASIFLPPDKPKEV